MKADIKFIVLIVCLVLGLALLIWGNVIMVQYEGFREIWKAARHAALPQLISGLVLLCIGYFLTYVQK